MGIKLELKKLGVSTITVKMTFEDSAMGHYMEGTMALSAEFFRLQNNERALAMKKARALEGYWPRNAPLGYKHIKAETGKILVKKEPEATRIKEGLEGYAC